MNIQKAVLVAFLFAAGVSACSAGASRPAPSPTLSVSSPPLATPTVTLVASPPIPETPAAPLPPTPEPAPTPEHIRPSLLMPTPEPGQILGGGIVKDGPFRFLLWVIRDPTFGHHPVAPSLYSDIEGRAIYMGWIYEGEKSLPGPLFEYWGLPWPRPNFFPSEYPRVEPGWGGGRIGGIHFSPDLLPGSPPPDGPIKVGFFLITPEGRYGACIQFALTADSKDIDPSTITLGPLPCDDLSAPR